MTLMSRYNCWLLYLFLSLLTDGVKALDDVFGLRKDLYIPRCAYACREAISSAPLQCTSNTTHMTSSECYATNDIYLYTLALCISVHCEDNQSLLDEFWTQYVVGWKVSSPVPKYNYREALMHAGFPTEEYAPGQALDHVRRVVGYSYNTAYASLGSWTEAEQLHSKFALSLFLAGFVGPIALSSLRFAPLFRSHASLLRAILIHPTLWSHKWSIQIREAGDISSTRGQAIFILYLLVLNVVLASVGHFASANHFWSVDGRHGQFITCLANRFGALAMANMPLMILYQGRNNLLLRITDWSHTTFIMIHRWLGYFIIAEAILHSIIYLHIALFEHQYATWSHMPAWYMGSIATTSMSLIAPLSIVYLRKRSYELFLFIHVILSILMLVGTYYHISDLFKTQVSGWILYFWVAIILWGYDRIARIFRLLLGGVHTAKVTIIDDEYIRLDIPNARGRGHAYLYFPTLTFRFWENHPFSIAFNDSTRRLSPEACSNSPVEYCPGSLDLHLLSASSDQSTPSFDMKSLQSCNSDLTSPCKSLRSPLSPGTLPSAVPWSPVSIPISSSSTNLISPQSALFLPDSKHKAGKDLVFFMRTHGGTTAHLRKRKTLPVLIEASYGKTKNLSMYPVLICVAGGVGITAILPYLHAHRGTTRLYWGLRSQGLFDALKDNIRDYQGEISIGRRMLLQPALQREFSRVDGATPVAVVVSGPRSMGEEVRDYCCEVARVRKGEVRFLDQNFSW